MTIDMVRMPPEISTGFAKQLDFGTAVTRLDFGGREVSRTREMPRRYWQARKGVFPRARIEEFAGFVQARSGAFHGFRFWDPSDFSTNPTARNAAPSMLDQFLGYGDGVRTEFDLVRVYPSTSSDLTQRRAVEDRMLWLHGETDDRLAKCIGLAAGTVFNALFAADSVAIPTFSINHRRRSVIFGSAPAMGEVVTGGAYYDWPVCLGEDTDANFETMIESWTAQAAPNIQLECLPFERYAPDTDDPGGAKTLAWSLGAPLLQKAHAKVWRLNPSTSGLSVMLEEPSQLNSGGPHFVLRNEGDDPVDVIDELTGDTITTVLDDQTAWMMVEDDGSTRNWLAVLT